MIRIIHLRQSSWIRISQKFSSRYHHVQYPTMSVLLEKIDKQRQQIIYLHTSTSKMPSIIYWILTSLISSALEQVSKRSIRHDMNDLFISVKRHEIVALTGVFSRENEVPVHTRAHGMTWTDVGLNWRNDHNRGPTQYMRSFFFSARIKTTDFIEFYYKFMKKKRLSSLTYSS